MPPPWISNIGAQQPQQPQQSKQQDNLTRSRQLADTMKNFNDAPVGRILGSSQGSPVVSAPTEGAAVAGAGEAAGAAAGEAGGVSALAELAPLAALA